ncbi:MAG TPA: tetratricopeptide repeat protein, partial [Thermoanaerobaculia bacterium]|nr:tetratricopeptide repeat protein [Thermoanaerobaculia bacterium]
ISGATVLFALVVLVAITIVVLLYARRFPFLAVGWFWYAGTLVPMSGIVKAGIQWIADRYTYLSYVGLFIAIVWGVWTFAEKRPALARAFAALAIVVIAALSVATFLQLRHWKDAQTLFTRTLEVTTKNPVAEANLAMVLYDRDKPKEALPHIQASVAMDPAISSSQYTLGRVLEANGDLKGAEAALRQAITLDPNFVRPYRALATLRQKAGYQSEALSLLTKASSLDENDASARAELAAAKGDVNGALAEYENAIAQSPDDANLRNDYATILARQQRDQQALNEYLEVVRLRPDHFLAHMNVGALLRRLGRDSEAIAHLMKAATLRPSAPEPHVYLALIYAVRNETSRAIAEIDAATRLDAAGANRYFTEVVRVPFRETNLADYRALLTQKR